jgi:hypothetical protein
VSTAWEYLSDRCWRWSWRTAHSMPMPMVVAYITVDQYLTLHPTGIHFLHVFDDIVVFNWTASTPHIGV